MSILPILKTAAVIAKRAAKLAGASSHTTKAQYGVLLGTAAAVAALGYFVPPLADDVVAVALIAAVAPLVSRLVLYRRKPGDRQPTGDLHKLFTGGDSTDNRDIETCSDNTDRDA